MVENKNKDVTDTSDVSQEIRDMVVARLKNGPQHLSLSLGSSGTFSTEDLIENVEKGTDVGNQIIEMQLNYIRGLQEMASYD